MQLQIKYTKLNSYFFFKKNLILQLFDFFSFQIHSVDFFDMLLARCCGSKAFATETTEKVATCLMFCLIMPVYMSIIRGLVLAH